LKKQFWSPRVKALLIAAVILAVLLLAVSAAASRTSFGANLAGAVLSPLRAGVAAIDRQAQRYYDYLFKYEKLQAENAELQKEVLSMEQDVRTAQTYQRENERLKTLCKLTDEHADYKMVSAYILSWNSSEYKSAFTIGKGTKSGLAKGMCAVTENGQVVGLVTDVGTNWATVTTIMDASMEISASITSSGYAGVVQGAFLPDNSNVLRMNYLLTDAVVKNDDQVVTTGSTLYPRGLLLGYVTNVALDETGVAKYATIQPSCDFSSLEQIFIITQYANQ
jgi:rod shape-determining protein MreC